MMSIGKPQTLRTSPVVEPHTYGFCRGTCESGWGDLSVKDIGTIGLRRRLLPPKYHTLNITYKIFVT